MDLREWRAKKAEGESMVLPSGLVIQLQRASVLDLAERGSIPAPLSGMMEKAMDSRAHALQLREFPKYAELINVVVLANLKSPPVAETADDEHLAITELSMEDRLAIFNWANQLQVKLEPFRQNEA